MAKAPATKRAANFDWSASLARDRRESMAAGKHALARLAPGMDWSLVNGWVFKWDDGSGTIFVADRWPTTHQVSESGPFLRALGCIRYEMRHRKLFSMSDDIRDRLNELGWIVADCAPTELPSWDDLLPEINSWRMRAEFAGLCRTEPGA